MSSYKNIRSFAREMRKNPTDAEDLMWANLRGRKLSGKKFNRQFVIEHSRVLGFTSYYIADFHCHEKKIIVEIDGDIHLEQLAYDKIREDTLREMGYKIIRFKNQEVLNDISTVLKKLRKILVSEEKE